MTKSLAFVTLVGVLGTLSFADQLKAGVALPPDLAPPVSQQGLYGDEGGDVPRAMTAQVPWDGDDVRLYYVGSKGSEGGEGGEGRKGGKGREGGEGGEGGEGLEFRSDLSAAQVTSDPASNGSGEVRAEFADDLSALFLKIKVRNLAGSATDANLHCAFAGQDGPVILALPSAVGQKNGKNYKRRFTNANVANADCVSTCGIDVNNIASLRFAADQGCIYAEVETTSFPDGEVRGQLLPK